MPITTYDTTAEIKAWKKDCKDVYTMYYIKAFAFPKHIDKRKRPSKVMKQLVRKLFRPKSKSQ